MLVLERHLLAMPMEPELESSETVRKTREL